MNTPGTTISDRAMLEGGASKNAANLLLGGGIVLILITALGAFHEPEQFAHSWLFAYLYFYTIAAGGLFWTMLHHATNAGWSTLIRRQTENLAALFPVILVLFIPLILCGPSLYHWMRPEVLAVDHPLQEKSGYLNVPFFYLRAAIFFTVFLCLAGYFRGLSLRQDKDGSPVHSIRMQRFACVLCAIFGFSFTFSAFDWIMSLDHHWTSTMFGVQIFSGAAASSFAVLIVTVLGLQRAGYLRAIQVEHYHLLGKVLVSFVMFWGWISYAQYMLTWFGNIPEETVFFIDRNKGSWFIVSILLITFNFIIPFLGLLTQASKKNPLWLGLMAGSVLLGHAIEIYWLVLPQIHHEGWQPHWLDLTTWFGLALVLASFYLRLLRGAALYPIHDPRLAESKECFN